MPGTDVAGAVFLDANVLVAAAIRDTLLRAADAGLFVPYWSERVLEEVERALISSRLADPTRARRLIGAIRVSFPAAVVADYESTSIAAVFDPDDQHVIDAAVAAKATTLVTINIRHFPIMLLREHGIEVESPDGFLLRLFAGYLDTLAQVIRDQSAALRAPPLAVADVLANLRVSAPTFAGLVADRLRERR